jgi:deoxycytidylate deaminase
MSENSCRDHFSELSISMEDKTTQEENKLNQNHEMTNDKRPDYLPWEDYFLAVAFLSAMRSKDPNTQVSLFEVKRNSYFAVKS